MRLNFRRGLAASLPLATASALASAFTPAHAVAPACVVAGVLSSYSSECTLPGGYGISLQITSPSSPNDILTIFSGNGAFGPSFTGSSNGSFNYVVKAQTPGTYFNFADIFISSNNTASVTGNSGLFTLDTNLESFTNSNFSLIEITGTYTYSSTANTSSSLKFTTAAVPAPLPLLGAGCAFGFSRKLRKRIKLAA